MGRCLEGAQPEKVRVSTRSVVGMELEVGWATTRKKGGKEEKDTTHLFGILDQAKRHKILESTREIPLQHGWSSLGNEEQHAHRMIFRQRWFSFSHLDRRDSEGPDVGFRVVASLTDHLRGHPVRGSCGSVEG